MESEPVVSFVIGKLGDLLIEEARFLYEVRGQIERIERELKRMKCFLNDADEKQKGDESVRNWVEEIRGLSYDAEDVIDRFMLSQRRRRGLGGVKSYICIVTELPTRHKIGQEIQGITEKIAEITKSLSTYGIKHNNDGSSSSTTNGKRALNDGGQGSSLNDRRRIFAQCRKADNVIGLQEILTDMKKQLISKDPSRCVISIVGMGGSGKTTLAKKVYNDIKGEFDCHALVYLSREYNILGILKHIKESLKSQLSGREKEEEKGEEKEKPSLEDLEEKIGKLLGGKRYLIVIDDIWTCEAWNELNRYLPDDLNRSRVLLTTRNKEVALFADRSGHHLHQIRILNPEESWELFLKTTFSEEVICPPDLMEIGREIVAECDGLPLAIVVLGSLLSTKKMENIEWSKVLASVHWHLAQKKDSCMEILALSYYDLPDYLKPCFLYLGLFPEDFEIRSRDLIRLWVAEGFIQKRDDELIEDVAEDYLEELIHRSMIQVARERSNGFASRCRIHDLLRDLCISEAKEANFFVTQGDNGTTSPSTSVRRLALYDENETTNQSSATLRSMLYFSKSKTNFSKLLNRGHKLLRVLHVDIDDSNHEKHLPNEIGEEGYLRYFRFSGIQSLPSSIGNLSDLQTIILTESRYAGILPNAICYLKKLRHLYAYRWKIDGHPRLGNLINLQTLCLRAGGWIEDGLDKLTNLRKLGILGSLSPHQKALSNAIEKLCNLQSFKLSYSFSIPPFVSFARHKYLYKMFLDGRIENLPEIPPNLAKLTLYRSKLQKDAIQTLEKLEKLRTLRLYEDSYRNEQIICSSGGFPQLESLELDCDYPKDWVVEKEAMKSLKRVKLGRRTDRKTVPKPLRRLSKEETKWSISKQMSRRLK